MYWPHLVNQARHRRHLLLFVAIVITGFLYKSSFARRVTAPLAGSCVTPPLGNKQYALSVVSRTNGFYVRDWSLGLGWHNLRQIIEASLLHAKVLNRTLVLPSFVYARSCEFEQSACADFGTMVNLGDAVGWDEWRALPIEQQMAWKVPLNTMLDLTALRAKHNVILTSEFLALRGLSPSLERSNGAWQRVEYLGGTPALSIAVIPNNLWDPSSFLRVDTFEGTGKTQFEVPSEITKQLKQAMGNASVLDWPVVQSVLHDIETDEGLELTLSNHGWVVLHTFRGFAGMDFIKSPVNPIKQISLASRVRGLLEDFGQMQQDILLLEGETHLYRKPGELQFTSTAARNDFANMVFLDIRPPPAVQIIADRIVERISQKVQGRMWMGAHMRRGDFERMGWAMEADFEQHLARIKDRLHVGQAVLDQLSNETSTFDVLHVPREDDIFFLATDERSAERRALVKAHGAILIDDLFEFDDRRFLWGLLLGDVVALVEAAVLAQSHYFYGHAMSSFVGAVVNARASRGADPRTCFID